MWTTHQIHSSRLVHHSGTARTNFNMLFPLVSEGWAAREGYWRNKSYSTDYQRQFPLTLCTAIIWNSYNGKYCCLYCKGLGGFVTDVNLYPFSLQPHRGLWLNQVKGWTWNTTQGKMMSWYKIMLADWICTKKPKRSSCDLAHARFDQTPLLLQRQCIGRALADFLETRQSRSTVTKSKLTH